jgi:glutathionyl-hydroquinone reductase
MFVCIQAGVDLYPEEERENIDRMNNFVYNRINNGTYKSGFATTQEAYDVAQKVQAPLFPRRVCLGSVSYV